MNNYKSNQQLHADAYEGQPVSSRQHVQRSASSNSQVFGTDFRQVRMIKINDRIGRVIDSLGSRRSSSIINSGLMSVADFPGTKGLKLNNMSREMSTNFNSIDDRKGSMNIDASNSKLPEPDRERMVSLPKLSISANDMVKQ